MPSHANLVNWFEIPVNDMAGAKTSQTELK